MIKQSIITLIRRTRARIVNQTGEVPTTISLSVEGYKKLLKEIELLPEEANLFMKTTKDQDSFDGMRIEIVRGIECKH